DLNGDGTLEVVTSPDASPTGAPYFNVWSVTGQQVGPNVYAFEKGFHGGVRVAVGDVNGDGRPEVIASAGPGGQPFVQVINLAAGGPLGLLSTYSFGARFLAFSSGFLGGVTVAAGVLDASGASRLVVGADAGDGSPNDAPVLRLFAGNGTLLTDSVFAFEQGYHGGVNVATSLDGRGRAWALAAPARARSPINPVVDVFSAAFALLPQSFSVIDL